MANQRHFGVVNKLLGFDEVDSTNGSHRRRLVFVRRTICFQNQTRRGPTDTLQAQISAADNVPQMNAGPNQPHWLPFGSTFFTDNRFETMKRMSGSPTAVTQRLRPFSVIIGSMLYLGFYNQDPLNKLQQCHYILINCGEAGVHMYINRWGKVTRWPIYIEMNGQFGQALPKDDATINAIYPVIRYEWDKSVHKNGVKDEFVFGLYFSKFNDYREGDRYYHRFDEKCLQAGGVFELTSEELAKFTASLANNKEGNNFVVLYVCAGAKLSVIDYYTRSEQMQLNQDKKIAHHNRSLVQQGGIVICAMQNLNVVIPVEDRSHSDTDEMNFKLYDWRTYCRQYLTPPPANVTNPADISNPVIFLSAVDSRYNSLSWDIALQPKYRGHNTRIVWSNTRVILMVPFGGRFTAIVEGNEGITEIVARIQYEMLHDSVVTNHGIQFRVPTRDGNIDRDMLRRILFDNRAFESYVEEYNRTDVQGKQNRHMPRTFNFSTVTNIDREGLPGSREFDFFKFVEQQNSRLTPPPMYPPVFVKDIANPGQLNDDQMYYIPSQEFQIPNVEICYGYYGQAEMRAKFLGNEYTTDKTCLFYAYHYERLEVPQDHYSYENKTGLCHGKNFKENSQLYRIGVDGWLWKKVSPQPIYVEKTFLFYREKNEPAQTRRYIGTGLDLLRMVQMPGTNQGQNQ